MHAVHSLIVFGLLGLFLGCETKTKTPSAPPVPDIPLPPRHDAGSEAAQAAPAEGDGGTKAKMEDPKSPIAPNLLEYVPHMFAGVKARQRQAVKTAPIAYAFYKGDKKTYNVSLTGPNQKEAERRAAYPLLGKDEKETMGTVEIRGLKVKEFDAVRLYDKKKRKSEAIVLVNPFVEVKVTVQPTDEKDEALEHLDELDLEGISTLR